MDPNVLLRIEGLRTRFHFGRRTVSAVDGLDLEVRRSEILGLVGESGCGKSVTADSILRLVSAPGEIESGRILLSLHPGPGNLLERLMDLEGGDDRAEETAEARQDYEQLVREGGLPLPSLGDRYRRYRAVEGRKGRDDPEAVRLREELLSRHRHVDLLELDQRDLQQVRGKLIAAVFQEPLRSLDPVLTCGYQISEAVILHERRELAAAVLKRLEDREGPGLLATSILSRLYRRMLYDPDDALLDICSRVPLLRRYQRPLRREALRKAISLLEAVKIPVPEEVSASYPHELSGGMQQRVVIAMALACRPALIIADEPTTALDVTIQRQVLGLIQDLRASLGTAVLLITHNLGIVAETCDRVAVMYAGSIVEIAPCLALFSEPLHPYTRGLMEAVPRIDQDADRLHTIEGTLPDLAEELSGCHFRPRCPCAMPICSTDGPVMRSAGEGHWVAYHLYREEAR